MAHNIYIKILFAFLVSLGSVSLSKAQTDINSKVTIIRDAREFVDCRSLSPVDLNRIMQINVAPHAGYWADSLGIPLKGGSLFDPIPYLKETTSGAQMKMDTVFYFIFTNADGGDTYCGMAPGTAMRLDLHLTAENCRTIDYKGIRGFYYFCYNDYTEKSTGVVIQSPYDMASLLFSTIKDDKDKIFYKDARVSQVFADTLGKEEIFNWYLDVNKPNGLVDTLWVDIVLADGHKMDRKKVVLEVFKESTLTIKYDILGNYPVKDLFANQLEIQEIDISSKLTVYVPSDEVQNFESYKYYLNQQYLNKYLASGDTTSSSINVDALMFSGAEDIVAIVARTKDSYTNSAGDIVSANCFVRAEDRVVIDIPLPNVFTPDGDGVNDILFGGEKFRNREFHLEVFNRWGNQIYSGEKGWDGTYRGEPVPPGVYQYVIILKRADGTPATVKGTVTLIRKGL